MGKKTDKDWAEIELKLASLGKPELLALLKAMFGLTTENRFFLSAKFPPETGHSKALETHRRRIVEQFFPKRCQPTLNLNKAEKTIDSYLEATDDLQGWYDLLLTLVESGVAVSDPATNEEFYDRMLESLTLLTGSLADYGDEFYPVLRSRLMKLAEQAKDIRFGCCGELVRREVKKLEEKMQTLMRRKLPRAKPTRQMRRGQDEKE